MADVEQKTRPGTDAVDLAAVDEIVGRTGRGPEHVIPILQAIQSRFMYLPREALRRVCEISDITPAAITGVSTFYSQFRHRPAGEHVISVCHGTACHVKGSQDVSDALCRHLDIAEADDTDPAGLFTVQKVACLGCCTLAPVLQIDGITYGHLKPDTVSDAVDDFLRLKELGVLAPPEDVPGGNPNGLAEIRVGLDSCCIASGSRDVYDALERAVRDIGAPAVVKRVGCVGMCHQAPLVEIATIGGSARHYARVRPADARRIVLRHFKPRGPLRKIRAALSDPLERLLTDDSWHPVTRYSIDTRETPVCEFLGPQKHLAIEHLGTLDPVDLDEYVDHGGFKALERAVKELSPEEILEQVARSGLRGRGGAGYPTGRKWRSVREAEGETKYVICNGDEGDPGAFMDRMLLESYPYRVLEGMAIAARAVGADRGYLYIRAEYPLAVGRIRQAIKRCEERGFLGREILKSGFTLNLRVMEGAGAFVCGEETALFASIEGRRGTPRLRPPYPSERGLWGMPTLINNVETYAVVPWITRNGPDAFAALGTEKSRGTKVFALAGKVARGGLIEVPMGITIREIVEDIGGAAADGKRFKAVQVGGPSGGCLPAHLADRAIDYEALDEAGAIMGSGGLVVLDETDCMVDIARYFLQFTQDQSCGKCSTCRIGTRRMLDILDRLCTGHARKGDLERLEELGRVVTKASLCGLGRTAPNPVLTTLKYFRDEYEAHMAGRCPAAKCKALITYSITDDCIGCTRCAQHCPADAIEMNPYEKHEIDTDKCVRCGTCSQVCPADAVKVE